MECNHMRMSFPILPRANDGNKCYVELRGVVCIVRLKFEACTRNGRKCILYNTGVVYYDGMKAQTVSPTLVQDTEDAECVEAISTAYSFPHRRLGGQVEYKTVVHANLAIDGRCLTQHAAAFMYYEKKNVQELAKYLVVKSRRSSALLAPFKGRIEPVCKRYVNSIRITVDKNRLFLIDIEAMCICGNMWYHVEEDTTLGTLLLQLTRPVAIQDLPTAPEGVEYSLRDTGVYRLFRG